MILESPERLLICNNLCTLGLRKSQSINNTFLYLAAMIRAKLVDTVLFPSLGAVLTTLITWILSSI